MSDGENATPGRPGDAAVPGTSGHHTEGIAVADVLAKVTGSSRLAPITRHRAHPPGAHPPGADSPGADSPDAGADATVPISVAARARNRRRRPALLAARSAAVLIAVSTLAVTGAAWQWQSAKNSLLNTIAALDPNSSDIRDRNAQNGDENFLIIGVDSRIGANGEIGAGDTSIAEGARSDTIMLVNIPANRSRVVAVSFPRDLGITPINCQAWDPETGRYGPVYDRNTGEWSDNERLTTSKLNSAYALGGPKCLVKAIQKISGLAINRFMAVDFAGFSAMVDALGGVEVCTTTPLEDTELGTVLATAGRQKLDGPTALNYVRARSITTEDNGDYGRIKRQQLFLSSLLRSMISTETLFDVSRLNEVVNTFIDDSFVDNIQTRDLVRLGQSLQGMNAGRITFVTVPTTGLADEEGNEQPRTEDIQALFDAIIEDEPLPGENDNNETLSPLTVATMATQITTSPTTTTTSTSPTESGYPTSTTAADSATDSADTTVTEEVTETTPPARPVHRTTCCPRSMWPRCETTCSTAARSPATRPWWRQFSRTWGPLLRSCLPSLTPSRSRVPAWRRSMQRAITAGGDWPSRCGIRVYG
jgi:LCP family protein required for cell wall assembly